MNIKLNLLLTGLIVALVIVASMWWDARGERNALQNYAESMEAEYDEMKVELLAEKEVSVINAKRLGEKDEIIKELEERNLELISNTRTTVVFDTIYAVGEADTVYTNGDETVYRLNDVTPNYTLMGTIEVPSGYYKISVVQKPFGLEIREVTTPSGRKQVYANIVGRNDLKISNVEFYAEDVKTKKEKIWALGVGTIVAEGQVDWGILLRRNRVSVIGTQNSVSAGFELLRF